MGSCRSRAVATAEEEQYICKTLAAEMLGLCLVDVMKKQDSVRNSIEVASVHPKVNKIKEASEAFFEAADAQEDKAIDASEEKPAEDAEDAAEDAAAEPTEEAAADMTHYALAKVLRRAAWDMEEVYKLFQQKAAMAGWFLRADIEQAFKEQLKDFDLPDAFLVCGSATAAQPSPLTDAVLASDDKWAASYDAAFIRRRAIARAIDNDANSKNADADEGDIAHARFVTGHPADQAMRDYMDIILRIDKLQLEGMPEFVRAPEQLQAYLPPDVSAEIVTSLLVSLIGEREAEIRELPANRGQYPDIFEKVFKNNPDRDGVDKLLQSDYKAMQPKQ